jgi:hypothetical protein
MLISYNCMTISKQIKETYTEDMIHVIFTKDATMGFINIHEFEAGFLFFSCITCRELIFYGCNLP